MAAKLGAREVDAFDIDEWSVLNGQENIERNQTSNIRIQQGKISEVTLSGKYDIILANINKNILLSEMSDYANYLAPGGLILFSGFYTHDIDDLNRAAVPLGLIEQKRDERETWATLLMKKSS
jgi:ribosomal protein L11 methyltransferase